MISKMFLAVCIIILACSRILECSATPTASSSDEKYTAAGADYNDSTILEEAQPYSFRKGTKVIQATIRELEQLMQKIRHPKVKDKEAMERDMGSIKFQKMMKDANDPTVAKTNPVALCALVLFYTTWCDACQDVMPDFDSAATDVKYLAKSEGDGHPLSRVVFVAVNVTDKEIRDEAKINYNLKQYPSLQWWRGGFYSHDYPGRLPMESSDDLVDWIIFRMTATDLNIGLEELTTVSEAREFIDATVSNKETAVIGFLDDPQDGGFASGFAWMQFQRFAVDVDKVRLGMVVGQGSGMLASTLGARDRPPVLMAYRDTDVDFVGEKTSVEYTGPFVQGPMREWLEKDALMPKLAPFHDEHYQWKLLGSSPLEQEILGLVFSTKETPLELSKTLVAADTHMFAPRDYSLSSADPMAVERNLRFVRVEHTDSSEESKSLQDFYGVKQDELPALVFINGKAMSAILHVCYTTTAPAYLYLREEVITDIESKRWKFGHLGGEISVMEIANYASEVLTSEIAASPRGEAIPLSNDFIVKVVVRDTWDEYVYDQDKDDVFVLLHTEEGDVSAEFMSVFHAVGDLFQQINSTGISLVSCDILNNAIDGMEEFQLTPAIFHFPPKTRRAAAATALENETGISMYQGGASMNSLIGFMKEVSSVAEIPYDIECEIGIDEMDSTIESPSQNSTESDEIINNNSKRSIDMRASASLNTGGNRAGHSEL